MNYLLDIFYLLSLILFALIFALIALFLFCLSIETIIYLLRKTPFGRKWLKPLTSFYAFPRNNTSTNNREEETNYSYHIKDFTYSFLLFLCPFKRVKSYIHPSYIVKEGQHKTKNCSNCNTPNIVNQPIENGFEHSGINVSQGGEAYQPKQKRTKPRKGRLLR